MLRNKHISPWLRSDQIKWNNSQPAWQLIYFSVTSPAIYFQVWSCQMRWTILNIIPNRFRFFQPKLFQILYWTKLIIFNQCFLSNCWISIEHINTSNGLDLLQQPTNHFLNIFLCRDRTGYKCDTNIYQQLKMVPWSTVFPRIWDLYCMFGLHGLVRI